jgi:hypothetical protein
MSSLIDCLRLAFESLRHRAICGFIRMHGVMDRKKSLTNAAVSAARENPHSMTIKR